MVYGVGGMGCVKDDELRCHVTTRPAAEKNLETRVYRSVYV